MCRFVHSRHLEDSLARDAADLKMYEDQETLVPVFNEMQSSKLVVEESNIT